MLKQISYTTIYTVFMSPYTQELFVIQEVHSYRFYKYALVGDELLSWSLMEIGRVGWYTI